MALILFIGFFLNIGKIWLYAIPVLLMGTVFLVYKQNQLKKRASNLYNFQCNICGYSWSWMQGTPWPEDIGKENNELIEKGNQLLEKQSLQRQQDEAALQHLIKKN